MELTNNRKGEIMNEIVEYQMPLTASQVKGQVQLIQEVMAAVMVKGVHYGTIPGTDKPTLYKPGSEKILSTFRIAAYPKEIEDLSSPDEIRYRVKVHGLSMDDGRLIGVGIGECSSSEGKYKWRKPVCNEEYDETPEDRKREVWKKYDQKTYQQKQVRMNPSDVANTILKMAKKRAQIDLTLTATGASDVFDQDLEDMSQEVRESVVNGKKKEGPPLKQPAKKAEKGNTVETIETLIVDIKESSGEKDGKPWTRWGVKGEDDIIYGTFSETFADLALSAAKAEQRVKITFKKKGKFTTITDLEIIEGSEEGL